jgi:hypothetical protein
MEACNHLTSTKSEPFGQIVSGVPFQTTAWHPQKQMSKNGGRQQEQILREHALDEHWKLDFRKSAMNSFFQKSSCLPLKTDVETTAL